MYTELFNPHIKKPVSKVAAPPGFSSSGPVKVSSSKKQEPELDELKVKKAWEIAFAPAKSIPMNLIMSYMTGNSLQIIPIMMTFMLVWGPLKAIFTETNASFKSLQTKGNSSDILLTKAVFVLCQLVSMSVGVWKLNKMGLIPTSESDWLAWKSRVVFEEVLR